MRTENLTTRRQALGTLTAGTLAARTAFSAPESESAAPFRFGALDHLALAVDDTERSVRFYTRIFGNTVLKEKANPRQYVKLGPNYVAMAPAGKGQPSQVVNHFCPGIVNFDLAGTKRALDQMGIQYREATGVGLFVPDPDGTLVQLWDRKTPGAISAKPQRQPQYPLWANLCCVRHWHRPHPHQRLEHGKIHGVLREDHGTHH